MYGLLVLGNVYDPPALFVEFGWLTIPIAENGELGANECIVWFDASVLGEGDENGGGEKLSTGELLQLSFLLWVLSTCFVTGLEGGDFWTAFGLLSSLGVGEDTALSCPSEVSFSSFEVLAAAAAFSAFLHLALLFWNQTWSKNRDKINSLHG